MVVVKEAEIKLSVTGKGKLKKDIQQAESRIKSLGRSIKGMGIAAKAGFGIAGFAVGSFVLNASQASLAFEQRFKSFTKIVEGDANNFLEQLNRAAKGTVSNLGLVTQANNALLLGIKQEQLPELLAAAKIVGAAVGRTTEEAFADITIGIGRQSRLILDNLGIIIRAGDVYKDYAESMGVATSALTTQDRQLAFNQAAMNAVKESADRLEGSIDKNAETVEQAKKKWADFKVELGGFVVTTAVDVINVFKEINRVAGIGGTIFREFTQKISGPNPQISSDPGQSFSSGADFMSVFTEIAENTRSTADNTKDFSAIEQAVDRFGAEKGLRLTRGQESKTERLANPGGN